MIPNSRHDMINEKFTPVARNAIWREHVAKEKGLQKLRLDFTTNPHKMYTITDKPHKPAFVDYSTKYNLSNNTNSFESKQNNYNPNTNSNDSNKYSLFPPINNGNNNNNNINNNNNSNPSALGLLSIPINLSLVGMSPRNHRSFPITSNQQYGYEFDEFINQKFTQDNKAPSNEMNQVKMNDNPSIRDNLLVDALDFEYEKWQHGKKMCPITTYVHAYLVNQGHSPFSNQSNEKGTNAPLSSRK